LAVDGDHVRAGAPRHQRAHVAGVWVARTAAPKVRPGARCCSWAAPAVAASVAGSLSSRRSPPRCLRCTASLALELAPVRVNLIAAGFVDTPLSASLLGDQLEPAAVSSVQPFPSSALSGRPMSPLSPSTS
jgi:NAD(P)-dependent dehydrogenase (short-subunit alcohol dehydrogenase family)